MTASFHAFIDEAGDEGFKFLDFPSKGSSEWFVISAVVVRETRKLAAARDWGEFLKPIEDHRKCPLHFRKLPHEAKVQACHALSTLPIRALSVCIHKPSLLKAEALAGNRRLHFYAIRFLLERLSWLVRDNSRPGEGDGRCSLTFSKCKGLSYENLEGYLQKIRRGDSKVAWDSLHTDKLKVLSHTESIWLKAVDVTASSTLNALELSHYGFCEDRYVSMLKPLIYNKNGNFLSYGMKIFPAVPEVQKERANRYDWLAQFKNR